MSSECAPRQRIVRLFPFAGDKGIPSTVECSPWILAGRLGWALPRSGHVLLLLVAIYLPDFPRCLAGIVEVIQRLFVLERIHGGEEPIVGISYELLLLD